jgi:hypothetical protein
MCNYLFKAFSLVTFNFCSVPVKSLCLSAKLDVELWRIEERASNLVHSPSLVFPPFSSVVIFISYVIILDRMRAYSAK